jgi:hypothetical protein
MTIPMTGVKTDPFAIVAASDYFELSEAIVSVFAGDIW